MGSRSGNIKVEINGAQAAKDIAVAFAHLGPEKIRRGIALALNLTAGSKRLSSGGIRRLAGDDIREIYNIPKSYLNSKLMPIGTANKNRLHATISLVENPIPMGQFLGTHKTNKGVSVSILKGKREIIEGAFLFKSKFSSAGSKLSVMHRSYTEGGSSYSGSFRFRNKRISSGSDLPIGMILSVSPLHALFRDQVAAHVAMSGGALLEKNMNRVMNDMAAGLIKDYRGK